MEEGPRTCGVDIAAGGEAQTVCAVRVGWRIIALHAWRESDLMETVARIVSIARALPADRIVIDATGVGAGVFDRLRELDLPAVPFNGAEGTDRTDASGVLRFLNKRAAAWWGMRELLHPHSPHPVTLPQDPELLRDLTCPRYKTDAAGGKLAVERKSELVKRLGRSPDKGDAVVMAFWSDDGAYESGYQVHTAETLRELTSPSEEEVSSEASAAAWNRRLWKEADRGRWLRDRG